jgi:RNA polymerase sigma factor (TIGR02999 family)
MDLEPPIEGVITIDDLKALIGELRMMARGLLALEGTAHSFTPTALAMTALRRAKLKEQDWEQVRWENRAHFFSAIARAMRNALIDHARRRKSKGRDSIVYLSPYEPVFETMPNDAQERPERIILLEEALARLEAGDRQLAAAIHQFYFAGYTTAEMARFAGVSEKTIDRELKRARVMLKKIMEELAEAA